MRQYSQAKDCLEQILTFEHAQTEAILVLSWSLTASLVLEHNMRSAGKFTDSEGSKAVEDELTMVQDCLKILHRKPFFKALVTKSACLTLKAKLMANLGDEKNVS